MNDNRSFRGAMLVTHHRVAAPGAAAVHRAQTAQAAARRDRSRRLAAMRAHFVARAPPRVELIEAPAAARGTRSGDDDESTASSTVQRVMFGDDDDDRSIAPPQPRTPCASEASSVHVDADDDGDACPLCAEQAYYLVRRHRDRALASDPAARGRACAVKSATDMRLQLFQLEQSLAISEPDTVVFSTLLRARRVLVERVLDRYSVKYTPWTLADVERHFTRHRIDQLRSMRASARQLRGVEARLAATTHSISPETGEMQINLGHTETLVRVGRQLCVVEREIDRLVKEREREYGSAAVRIPAMLEQLRAAEQSALGDTRDADDVDVGAASLSLGGL